MLCDFAQYYHIYDLEALPVRKLAALSFGLPPDSRSYRRLTGQKLSTAETLLAAICDRLSILVWQNTKDGQRGKNRPKSILAELVEEDTKPKAFESGEDFLAAFNAINGGGKNSN